MKVLGDRIRMKTSVRLRYCSTTGSELKYLEQGSYVQIINPYYLPRDFDIPYSTQTEDVAYTQFGLGIIPKGVTEKERL